LGNPLSRLTISAAFGTSIWRYTPVGPIASHRHWQTSEKAVTKTGMHQRRWGFLQSQLYNLAQRSTPGETENRTQSIGCVPSGELSPRPNKRRRKDDPVRYQFPKIARQKGESRKECVPHRYQFRP